jgi:hypothetical protein
LLADTDTRRAPAPGGSALAPGDPRAAATRHSGNRLEGYDPNVSRATPFVDEIANELDTWPGVAIERRPDGAAVVRYERLELGILDHERGTATLTFSRAEHDELVERGDAQPADPSPASREVIHHVAGASDVTEVLALFDRRYRDLRGEDEPYSSEDPA